MSVTKITPDEAVKLIENGVKLIDVREKGEYDNGHIPSAINIPVNLIQFNSPDILVDKSETLIVYCQSGMRSQRACNMFDMLGYKDIKDLGGIMAWPYDVVR